jgi:predicted Zn-dependent protease
MRKSITVLLFVFIALIFSYLIIRYFGNAEQKDNWFNNNFREKFVRYPVARDFFNLHWDGDARSDYLLSDEFTGLRIEIDHHDECVISQDVLDKFVSEVEQVIQKPGGVTITRSNEVPLAKDSYNREEIRAIASLYQNYSAKGDEAVLYVLCLNTYDEQPSNIGLTVHEDGIVIFSNAIKKITSNNPATFDSYLISTILHEFGHQLGLDHINSAHCIMAPYVESPGNAAGALQLVPTRYCSEELKAIEEIKDSLYND